MSTPSFDYVIVGAGAAGPVLAARLSEDPGITVALLEAGGENTRDVGRMQGAFFFTWGTDMDWGFVTEPQPSLGGRKVGEPRGRVVGGSTAINVGAWMRGCAADYDAWEAAGAAGWNAGAALEVFRRVEDSVRGPSEWRGRGGPLSMRELPTPTPFADTLLQAFTEAGLGPRGDVNGESLAVADRYETLFPHGIRRTPADAYLDEAARRRPNLRVITGAHVTRVLTDGPRATGVAYLHDGETLQVHARREVILCAGAFGTPQLLMLSGIGPAEALRAHGLPVVADLPGVGANLQEHLAVSLRALSPPGAGGPPAAIPGPSDLEAWRRDRSGLAAYWSQNGVGFVRSSPTQSSPDLELMFQYVSDLSGGHFAQVPDAAARGGWTITAILLQPRSRGTVTLASADPLAPPRIDPRFLAEPEDEATLVAGLRAAQRIAATPALRPHTEYLVPSAQADDAELRAWIRAEAGIAFHPVGSARMGAADDPMAVVDSMLRVRGVQGLRVADASVFPTTIRGHTMAPTVMVAERAAELIAGAYRNV
jgi:choline dehydrogenase